MKFYCPTPQALGNKWLNRYHCSLSLDGGTIRGFGWKQSSIMVGLNWRNNTINSNKLPSLHPRHFAPLPIFQLTNRRLLNSFNSSGDLFWGRQGLCSGLMITLNNNYYHLSGFHLLCSLLSAFLARSACVAWSLWRSTNRPHCSFELLIFFTESSVLYLTFCSFKA